MKSQGEILGLIEGRRSRRPARDLPFLDVLFRQLQSCHKEEAERTEDQIWGVWMDHPHAVAARVLDLATRDIAARRYDIAETRLTCRGGRIVLAIAHGKPILHTVVARQVRATLGRRDDVIRRHAIARVW